jgi:hypothetical protein
MIDKEEYYRTLAEMTEEERIHLLDPICQAVKGKAEFSDGMEVVANRIFALAVLDLYKEWQTEISNRE